MLGEYRANKPVAFSHWGEIWQKWWIEQRARREARSPGRATAKDSGWTAAPAELGYWETWNVPELGRYDGMMWFRARVTLDKAQAKQAAKLSLGLVDDVDVTWVNGRAVGNAFGDAQRLYDLPPKLLKAGEISSSSTCTISGATAASTVPRANARCCWRTARACR